MANLSQQFATAVLRKWGKPVTATTVRNLLGWMAAEGGHTHNKARFNFLNTTQPEPGAGNTGTQGNIKVYRNFGQGVDATVRTLNNGRYGAIGQAVTGDPNTFSRAVNASPWGTKSDFSSLISSSALGPVAPEQGGAQVAPTMGNRPDATRLLAVLHAQSQRSLKGIMPGAGYSKEIARLAHSAGAQVAAVATEALGIPSDPSKDQVVNAAKSQLGVPYVWGAGGPGGPTKALGHGTKPLTGFDCSSLVQYAWAKKGVQLPRTTYDQIHAGTGISTKNRSAWRPGDLLFPSTHHVQMYIGNGKVIEAPQTGGHVQVVSARSSYIAVRRPG
jgi:cell wall-associated NlpC family hydrolase